MHLNNFNNQYFMDCNPKGNQSNSPAAVLKSAKPKYFLIIWMHCSGLGCWWQKSNWINWVRVDLRHFKMWLRHDCSAIHSFIHSVSHCFNNNLSYFKRLKSIKNFLCQPTKNKRGSQIICCVGGGGGGSAQTEY